VRQRTGIQSVQGYESAVRQIRTPESKKPASQKLAGFSKCGRRERIRTSDPLVPNQLRYQAALLAELGRILLLRVPSVNPFFYPIRQLLIKHTNPV
jgi:hypothetical protein